MAKRPRYANNQLTFNLQPSTLAKRPRYANNQLTFNLQPNSQQLTTPATV
ncbi:MAG: hypothetical protein F6J90_00635 [Moorea sp. SIOASIH]|nr:hypothetical protein [Moorena sp. SIOASIH]NEO34890.1 hypothetical protein [Moorena sp. SIOASIH]